MHSYQTSRYQALQTLLENHLTHPTLPNTFRQFIIRRMLVGNIAVFFIQLIGVMLHFNVTSLIWLDTGTACAYIFMRGYRVLPGIFFAYFGAYYWLHSNVVTALLSATLLSFQPFLILWFTHRFISPSLLFYRVTTLIKFVIFIAIFAAMITANLLCVSYDFLQSSMLSKTWMAWTFANINGILIVGSTLTVVDVYFPQIQSLTTMKKWPLACLYTLILVTMVNVLCGNVIISLIFSLPLMYCISNYAGKCASLMASFIPALLLGLLMFLGMQVPSSLLLEIYLLTNILMAMFFSLT